MCEREREREVLCKILWLILRYAYAACDVSVFRSFWRSGSVGKLCCLLLSVLEWFIFLFLFFGVCGLEVFRLVAEKDEEKAQHYHLASKLVRWLEKFHFFFVFASEESASQEKKIERVVGI